MPHMTMETVDRDEHVVLSVRRHPVGILLLYVQAAVGLAAGLALIYFILPSFITDNGARIYRWVAAFSVIAIVLVTLVLVIASFIYRQSRILVTDKNITQVLQLSLFSRKVSQLNLANVEDVTAEQHGIIASIFNYGLLKIETAGEQANFYFSFCPRPNEIARQILEARENFVVSMGGVSGINRINP